MRLFSYLQNKLSVKWYYDTKITLNQQLHHVREARFKYKLVSLQKNPGGFSIMPEISETMSKVLPVINVKETICLCCVLSYRNIKKDFEKIKLLSFKLKINFCINRRRYGVTSNSTIQDTQSNNNIITNESTKMQGNNHEVRVTSIKLR